MSTQTPRNLRQHVAKSATQRRRSTKSPRTPRNLRQHVAKSATQRRRFTKRPRTPRNLRQQAARSEEHTSELQSLMRISYAVFCLKKKKKKLIHTRTQKNQQHEPTTS